MLAASSALSVLEATIPQLENVGFQRMVFEDFYDCLAGLINQIINPVDNRLLTIDLLLEAFNNPESESMIGSLLNRRSFLLTLNIAVQSSSLQLDCSLSTTAHVCGDQDESGLRRVSPPS